MASSSTIDFDKIHAAVDQFPRHESVRDKGNDVFQYGTAGFRMKADLLDHVMFSVGLTASLRSRKLNSQTIGVMITASHNPAEDNGVKLVDPQGEMLEQDWEQHAKRMANGQNADETLEAFKAVIAHTKIDVNKPARVIFARDTRPSGERLVKALIAGLEATGTEYRDYGILTTPQLHYLVKATNTQNTKTPYGEVSEEGYYKKMAAAFEKAMYGAKQSGTVTVDCANGVGAPKLKELLKHLTPESAGGLKVRIVNDNVKKPEILNAKCGADFVKTQQRVPAGFDGKSYDRWCSFDGDADRIIYFFNEDGPQFRMLDGDRIATLAAGYIGDLVQRAGLAEKVKLTVVQTAYANGSSTKHIEQTLKLKVECTATGVKHLHHAAARADIGVYFEANGHGTILFSPQTLKRIHNAQHEDRVESPAQLEALETLEALSDLINQTVGDAISDFLLTEVILAQREFTVREWLSTYSDLPNKLAKVVVQNRADFQTVPGTAERRLATPVGMQEQLDAMVAKYKDGRCFVRASGTEDAVRVYGEAAESYDVSDMVAKVTDYITSREGAGSPPSGATSAPAMAMR